MDALLIPALVAFAVIVFLGLVRGFKFPVPRKTASYQSIDPSVQPNMKVLKCRVQLTKQKKDNCVFDAFTVEICGSIHAPSDMHHTTLRILVTDVTDGIANTKPVHSRVKEWQMQDSPTFVYNGDLGKLPHADSTLSDWIAVAQLHLDWLRFPHKGKRDLRFSTSILSGQSGEELACSKCTFTYENANFGYINLEENIQHSKTLAVALAFAVSAADNKLFNCEVELIKNWARNNIDFSQASNEAKRKLDKALEQAIAFFRDGNQLNTYKICKEIVEIVPLADRYDILDLCLRVAQANGVATPEELALLKNLASWLEIATNRFHTMMEKILPVGMHKVKDTNIILVITSDMSKEETRHHLNEEYRKWNARVTNFDAKIKAQADDMLNFIAEARSAYIG